MADCNKQTIKWKTSHSPRTVRATALRWLWRRSTMTCCLLQTLANWLLSVYSTLQRRLALSTMTYYCFGWNGSSVSEELRSSGFAPTFPAALFVCFTAIRHPLLFTLCALCHKGLYCVRVFLFSTRRTLLMKWNNTKWICMPTPTTLSCICTVVLTIQLLLSHDWRPA